MLYTLFLLYVIYSNLCANMYIHINFVRHEEKCQNIYIKNKTFISSRVIFWFFPNLRKFNTITTSIKSIDLKTN